LTNGTLDIERKISMTKPNIIEGQMAVWEKEYEEKYN
jgi:hypothetical protein